MTFKTIAVCIDKNPESISAIKFAIELALIHQAHLKGLHISYKLAHFYDPYGQMADIYIRLQQSEAENIEMARETFASLVKLADLNFDWFEYQSSNISKIAESGRTSDLVISSQFCENDEDFNPAHSFLASFVIQLGRPLILIPRGSNLPRTFKRILIAWNGSREAARAVSDALPFLKEAKSVEVLTILRNEPEEIFPDFSIGDFLARHDVQCEIRQEKTLVPDSSEWLLTRAKEFHADLLVMGAFGQSRLSEFILGSMTKRVLTDLQLPVLMSH